jgi:aspartyl protease family protein
MSYSSGTRALFGEVASWVLAAGLCGAALVYFDEVRSVTARMMGLSGQAQTGAPVRIAAAEAVHAKSNAAVEIRAGSNGHYHAEAEINGRPIAVLVDTGASMVSLTYEDAERAGIFLKPSDFTAGVATANGTARVAPITLDRVSIGDIMVRNVSGTVSERGRLSTTLLGMSFLSRLERVDMRAGVLLLKD